MVGPQFDVTFSWRSRDCKHRKAPQCVEIDIIIPIIDGEIQKSCRGSANVEIVNPERGNKNPEKGEESPDRSEECSKQSAKISVKQPGKPKILRTGNRERPKKCES